MIVRTATRFEFPTGLGFFFSERIERRFVFVILKIKMYGFTYVMSAEVLVTFKLDLLVRPY